MNPTLRPPSGRLNAHAVTSLPLPADQISRAIDERERIAGTYLGRHLGMPHARLPGLSKPFVMIIRSEGGIPYPGTQERAKLLFVLLTPAGQPRIHQRLQAVIATLLDESEYVQDRLRTADTPAEVLDLAVALRRENPDRTAAAIARILRTQLGWAPDERTLQRNFHRLGLAGPTVKESPAVSGRFEAARARSAFTDERTASFSSTSDIVVDVPSRPTSTDVSPSPST